jgi:hypothetical protein
MFASHQPQQMFAKVRARIIRFLILHSNLTRLEYNFTITSVTVSEKNLVAYQEIHGIIFVQYFYRQNMTMLNLSASQSKCP